MSNRCDECLDRMMHADFLQLVHKALSKSGHLPFLFIIDSRLEPDIVSRFECAAGVLPQFQVYLRNDYPACVDIELFLGDKSKEYWKRHPFWRYIPCNWPSSSAIGFLVRKSPGHFIYSTPFPGSATTGQKNSCVSWSMRHFIGNQK